VDYLALTQLGRAVEQVFLDDVAEGGDRDRLGSSLKSASPVRSTFPGRGDRYHAWDTVRLLDRFRLR